MPLVVPHWLAEHVDLSAISAVEQRPSDASLSVIAGSTRNLAQTTPAAASVDIEMLAATLVSVGIEEEAIHGAAVTGPLVVGRVLAMHPEPQKNGKTINWCLVDVGPAHNTRSIKGVTEADLAAAGAPESGARGIVCGAHNFAPGDLVVVALPGTVLPGPFPIAARKTYGHVSDGMICSTGELGLPSPATDGDPGIIVLPRDIKFAADALTPGQDAIALLGLGTEVLEINVTPDRGYQMSYRGVAREYALATGAAFTDPGLWGNPAGVERGLRETHAAAPETTADGFAVEVDDVAPIHGRIGCDRFVTRIVRGVDPTAPTPEWLARRLEDSGMRSISLIVDITNYVMLDLGQPIHAYDLDKVAAPIVVRRANSVVGAPSVVEPVETTSATASPVIAGSTRNLTESVNSERLTTLDDVDRALDAEDLLITDSPTGQRGSRVLGLAGVMGGASSEITDTTTDVLIECAHFDPASIARTARRHKLSSEAAKRFERGVDPALPPVAAQRVVDLIVAYAGGVADLAVSDYHVVTPPAPIDLPIDLPSRIVGVPYSRARIIEILQQIGCEIPVDHGVVEADGRRPDGLETTSTEPAKRGVELVRVIPPTWRPDLTEPIDLVEEIVRIDGYAKVPSILPPAPGSRGLTREQRAVKSVARTLAEAGMVETLSYPFVSTANPFQGEGALQLANPLADDRPLMRTSLLATLSETAQRNVSRGLSDFGIFEIGLVTLPVALDKAPAPLPPGAQRPDDATLAQIIEAVPSQPTHVAGLLVGNADLAGWWGSGRAASWRDALEAVALIAERVGAAVQFQRLPSDGPEAKQWHPGRAAVILIGDAGAGHGDAAVSPAPRDFAPELTQPIGVAGELHPNVCKAFGLPKRTVGFEVDLDALCAVTASEPVQATPVSSYPAAKEDFAFVVGADTPAERVRAVIAAAAGELLEDLTLFDIYEGEQLGADSKSLAFSLRLRAPDRTLEPQEVRNVRDAVIAAAGATGAVLRGTSESASDVFSGDEMQGTRAKLVREVLASDSNAADRPRKGVSHG